MSGAISLSQSFWLENCTTCGIAFAMPQDFRDARLRDKKTFHCPNGHSLSYTQNEEDRLKSVLAGKERDLAAQQRLLAQAQQRESDLLAEVVAKERANARLAKRLKSGVCPVAGCKRHFTNLQRHIETEHHGVALPAAPVQKLIEGEAK